MKLPTERKRRTSGNKHSEGAKKLRKVTIEQISQLAQHIRYRLIGSNIQLDKACRYFDYRPLSRLEDEEKMRNSFDSIKD